MSILSNFDAAYFEAIREAETAHVVTGKIRCVCPSLRALELATRGTFSVPTLSHLPMELIRKYFRPAGPGTFEAQPALRSRIEFTVDDAEVNSAYLATGSFQNNSASERRT